MKTPLICFALILATFLGRATTLPVITASPTNRQVTLGGSATFSVTATGATEYQWRFKGKDIAGATNATLTVTAAQYTNVGYYVVIAKNSSGWVPSQMAYLFVGGGGLVPFSNYNIPQTFQTQVKYIAQYMHYGEPVTYGVAYLYAGPELDQMDWIDQWDISWDGNQFPGYYGHEDYGVPFGTYDQVSTVPNVAPGQTVYCQVAIYYPDTSYVQLSTVLKLVAGGGAYPVPVADGIKFPGWPEWPEPYLYSFPPYVNPNTNIVRVVGEKVDFTNEYIGYIDFGIPTSQWRKDGLVLTNATNFVISASSVDRLVWHYLTITNLQPSDAGVYDGVVLGNNWLVTPKFRLSVIVDGQSVLVSPRTADDTNFVCDVQGVVGRLYAVEWSTNLTSWSNLLTLTNLTGTATFTNRTTLPFTYYYRSRLLP